MNDQKTEAPKDGASSGLALASGSAIPAIQSAALNLGTAARDADNALECWDEEKWGDAVMWINNAIAQLESARSKISAHASLPNNPDEPTPASGGQPK